jgi:hypothetical protein
LFEEIFPAFRLDTAEISKSSARAMTQALWSLDTGLYPDHLSNGKQLLCEFQDVITEIATRAGHLSIGKAVVVAVGM